MILKQGLSRIALDLRLRDQVLHDRGRERGPKLSLGPGTHLGSLRAVRLDGILAGLLAGTAGARLVLEEGKRVRVLRVAEKKLKFMEKLKF
jgi:hypothetical protein